MQAWKELQYVNCYQLNSDNRNSNKKMTRTMTTRKAKKKMGQSQRSIFSSKMNIATTGPEQNGSPTKERSSLE